MLSEDTCILLAGYLDGELGRTQRQRAMQLLQQSSEARTYLQNLVEGKHPLQRLPSKQLPAEFPTKVLRAIVERGLRPLPAKKVVRHGVFSLARLAVAATILLAVGGISYLVYLQSQKSENVGPDPVTPIVEAPAPLIKVSHELAEFKEEKTRTQLAQELTREASVQLDLTVANVAQAMKDMAMAMKNANVTLLMDKTVAQFEKAKPKSKYLLFTENLRPEEVASLMVRLAGANEGKVVFNPLSEEQRGGLAKALGVKVAKIEQPLELLQGIQDATPEKGKKDAPPPLVKTKTQPPNRLAVVVPLNIEGGVNSAEVRRFFEKRQAVRSGTLQFVVVISQA